MNARRFILLILLLTAPVGGELCRIGPPSSAIARSAIWNGHRISIVPARCC